MGGSRVIMSDPKHPVARKKYYKPLVPRVEFKYVALFALQGSLGLALWNKQVNLENLSLTQKF